MNSIHFYNFEIEKGRIDCVCERFLENDKKKHDIFFEFERENEPSNDAIAIMLSTLIGNFYDDVTIDLEVSQQTKECIDKFTKVSCNMPVNLNRQKVNVSGNGIILNFSGGFDSLAAMCIMPKDTKLVAIDFGGWFQRETDFFLDFKPYILKTNFRQEKLDRSSWTFMGAGALLYAEYLNISYHVFGTNLESSLGHFRQNPFSTNSNETAPFSFMGLKDIRYTNGLTEVGTALIVAHYMPEIVNESLTSLANPRTQKRYRKELSMEIVCDKFAKKVNFEKTGAGSVVLFGTDFLSDFLVIYVLKNKGLNVANTLVKDIPQEVIDFIQDKKLVFYERLHTGFVCGSTFRSDNERADYMDKLLQAGILPYDETDFKEFRATADLLNKYYTIYPEKEEIKNSTEKIDVTVKSENIARKNLLYGGIQCYREHGFKYTVKRTLEHLGIPMGVELKEK